MNNRRFTPQHVSRKAQTLKRIVWQLWMRHRELRAGERLLTHVAWRVQPVLVRTKTR